MIDFNDLIEFCQVEAIANRLKPTEESVWRHFCRTYSKLFHTPLAQVLEMDPEHVILNIYEEESKTLDLEDYQSLEHIMDTIKGIEDPEYDRKKKEEQDEFDRMAELEEEERIKSGKAVHHSLQRDLDAKKLISKKEDPDEPKKPTGGYINLDYLSKQDSEG